jgi:hypothetical protein
MKSIRHGIAWLPVIVGVVLGCEHHPRKVAGPAPSATGASTDSTRFRFEDHGARFVKPAAYHNGREARRYAILESLGGGGAIWDYDGDGWLDVSLPGGGEFDGPTRLRGRPHHVWRGVGDGSFQEVTAPAGAGRSSRYTHGCAVGDWNSDGFADLLITGYGGVELWSNLGDGTLREVHAETGLTDASWSSSAGWADVNGDGWLDLYVAHYVDWSFDHDPECRGQGPTGRDVCPPREFRGLDDTLFLNSGGGTFTAACQEVGLVPEGKGLGVLLADFDHDADVDIYVANDTTDNFLYWNDGMGRFQEGGLVAGVALDDRAQPNGSMGLALGDFEGDLLPDLWVTNFEQETFALYRNLGERSFQHVSRASGVTALGSVYVGFGTVAEDFDLDGDEDLAVLNGHIIYHPPNSTEAQEPVFLENVGKARFQRTIPHPEGGYFQQRHQGRGLAAGDLDGDGLCDLLAVHNNEPLTWLRNASDERGAAYHVVLVGRNSNRDAVGARAILRSSTTGRLRHRYGGGSYLSQSDRTLRWGLPQGETFVELEIVWPDGDIQVIRERLSPGRWLIRQGTAPLALAGWKDVNPG